MANNDTELIRISTTFKKWLDKQKIIPNETYDYLLQRLLGLKIQEEKQCQEKCD
jgi:hypothetical protein